MNAHRLLSATLLMSLTFATMPASVAASEWYYSYSKAKAAAKREGKPLLLLIEHEGCPECARMDVAMSNSRAQSALSNAVKCRIEFTDHPELTQAFGVSLTPTMIVYS